MGELPGGDPQSPPPCAEDAMSASERATSIQELSAALAGVVVEGIRERAKLQWPEADDTRGDESSSADAVSASHEGLASPDHMPKRRRDDDPEAPGPMRRVRRGGAKPRRSPYARPSSSDSQYTSDGSMATPPKTVGQRLREFVGRTLAVFSS